MMIMPPPQKSDVFLPESRYLPKTWKSGKLFSLKRKCLKIHHMKIRLLKSWRLLLCTFWLRWIWKRIYMRRHFTRSKCSKGAKFSKIIFCQIWPLVDRGVILTYAFCMIFRDLTLIKNRFGTDFRIFSGFFPGFSGVGGMGGATKYAAAARRKL